MKQKSQELQEDSIQLSTNHRSPNPLSHGGGSHTIVYDPRPIQSFLTQLSVTQDPFSVLVCCTGRTDVSDLL